MNLKYFIDSKDYPSSTEKVCNALPTNVLWNYISSTYLNGFINYTKPVLCFLLDRYVAKDTVEEWKLDDSELAKRNNKYNLIKEIKTNPERFYHTKLNMFGDDLIIISEIEDVPNTYILFWFDMDCSDCAIGRFETEDTIEKINEEVISWLFDLEGDKYIEGFQKLPKTFLNGWLKF